MSEDREAGRAERRAEREARHAERHAFRLSRAASRVAGFSIDFGQLFGGAADGPDSAEETVERTFTVGGMPRLRVRNVSGVTRVRAGEAGQVKIVARKRVRGVSAERAKRQLENLEVRIEQRGDEIIVEPQLYEQERDWIALFQGKRFRVDFDIAVPTECTVDAQTVSGDLAVQGTRGPTAVQTVSGEVSVADLQGPLRVRSVSGEVAVDSYVGHLEGNSVSGGISLRGSRLRSTALHTVSGDIEVAGDLEGGAEHHFKTISGDVELALAGASYAVDFNSASGDLDCEFEARIERHGRHGWTARIGDGGANVGVKTVSGDLTLRRSEGRMPAASAPADERSSDTARTERMESTTGAAVREVLERLARGELDVEGAAAALDDARKRR